MDDWLIVLDKPAGQPSVPARDPALPASAVTQAQARWPDALTVHRLDMDTSGLLLLARGAAVRRALGAAFETGRVGKTYEAVVHGRLAQAAGGIDAPLRADWPQRPRQVVDRVAGKPALTRWQRLGEAGEHSRVALEPVSGRTHQLRVHLAHIGHPILGDRLYAGAAACAAAPRLLLHATRLALAHPGDDRTLVFESPAPF